MIRHDPAETGLSSYASESSADSQRASFAEEDTMIERAIVWAFGHALIQSEAALFYKTRMMLPGAVFNHDSFRIHLQRLEAKGLLTECHFQRRPCWRRLVEDADSIGETPSW